MAKKRTKKALLAAKKVRELFETIFNVGLEEVMEQLSPGDERIPEFDACLLSSDDLIQDPDFKALVAAEVDELIGMVQQYHDTSTNVE